MTTLIVGGAGYVGSHVCKTLSEAGFNPVAYDDLSTGHSWSVRFGALIRGQMIEAVERVGEAVSTQILPRLPHDSPALVAGPLCRKKKFKSAFSVARSLHIDFFGLELGNQSSQTIYTNYLKNRFLGGFKAPKIDRSKW